MPSRKTHDVVATVGTYKDGQGAEKKRFMNCGSAFTDEGGRISIKLDTVPVSPDWSGWLSLYVPKEKEFSREGGGQSQTRQQTTRPTQQAARPATTPAPARQPAAQPPDESGELEEEDIPF